MIKSGFFGCHSHTCARIFDFSSSILKNWPCWTDEEIKNPTTGVELQDWFKLVKKALKLKISPTDLPWQDGEEVYCNR